MLAPVYYLLFGKNTEYEPSVELNEDQIAISYKTYKSDRADDRQAIIDGKLAPGNYLQIEHHVLY